MPIPDRQCLRGAGDISPGWNLLGADYASFNQILIIVTLSLQRRRAIASRLWLPACEQVGSTVAYCCAVQFDSGAGFYMSLITICILRNFIVSEFS